MRLICNCCGRDINAIGQDNMSESLDYNLCEDCYKELQGIDREMFLQEESEEYEWLHYDLR